MDLNKKKKLKLPFLGGQNQAFLNVLDDGRGALNCMTVKVVLKVP